MAPAHPRKVGLVDGARCPRCWPWGELEEGRGELADFACRECRGRFLPSETAERVFNDLGYSPGRLRALRQATTSEPLRCAGCEHRLTTIRVESRDVELCFHCGGAWLDLGALEALSGRRFDETAPTAFPRALDENRPLRDIDEHLPTVVTGIAVIALWVALFWR